MKSKEQFCESIGFKTSRYFRLYACHISHSQIMLRSMRDEKNSFSKNIDIIFSSVYYIDVAAALDGLAIVEILPSEVLTLQSKFNKEVTPDNPKYFKLLSNNSVYYVVADMCSIQENYLDWQTIPITANYRSHWDKHFPNLFPTQFAVIQRDYLEGWLNEDAKGGGSKDIGFNIFDNMEEVKKVCEKIVIDYPLRTCYVLNHEQKSVGYYFNRNNEVYFKSEKNKQWWKFW